MIKKIVLYLFIALVSVMLACGGAMVPIREMAEAKIAITQAEEFEASKFSRRNYEAAVKYLTDSHTNVEEGKEDDAKENAKLAKKHALMAYEDSAPRMVDTSIKDAQAAIDRAAEANAEEFAPDQFTRAQVEARQAELHLSGKKYAVARSSALSAIASAEDARSISLSKKNIIRDSIVEVKSTLIKAKEYGADKDEPAKFKEALDGLKTSADLFKEDKLKESYTTLKSVKVSADELYLVSAQKASMKNIRLADSQLKSARKSSGAAAARDELNASAEMLSSARSQHSDTLFEESINSSDESLRLSALVLGEKRPVVVDEPVLDMAGKHKVEKNDFLRKLARRFYRDERKWHLIYNANKDQIKDPDLIYPDMILDIPEASSSSYDRDVESVEREVVAPVESDASDYDSDESSDYDSDDDMDDYGDDPATLEPSAEVSEEDTIEVIPE
ncbi:MAG: LysM peptidoglycan-binding domain-containing protein [Spirochaetes bacterium]|jgi:nucleoid-associated protein YgaU/L-lactate utilization protein LutC|nr:LysM peptidoglycan-binding domain-containing protein [Spirochaetota bacterium]